MRHQARKAINDAIDEYLDDSYDYWELDEMRDAAVEADQDEHTSRWDAVCKLADYKDAQVRVIGGKRVVIR